MKKFLRLLLVWSVGVVSIACVAATNEVPNRSPEEIEKLVSPIALYPDSLVAILLPASTESADVVLAARFLSYGGKESDIDKQFWHDTVKSLAHYPDLVKWMDENLDWTQQMGEVFAAQPADVMAAIQRLRAHARANGLLVDTPQQRVVVEQEVVYIVPANPGCIYIPRYDPDVLWMRSSFRNSFISFSVGFGVGNWLFYDCDWPGRTIWVHRRHPGWVYTPFWRPPPPAVRVNVVTAWRPSPHFYQRTHQHGYRPPTVVVVPRPFGPDHRFHSPGPDYRRDYHDRGPHRPLPPAQNFPGRPPVTVVSPVAPVAPMTHVGVGPSHRTPPPTVSNQRPHHNPQHFTPPPAPPSHEPPPPPQRTYSGPSRPGAGSATANLHRSAPRAPSEPSVNPPPSAPPPQQQPPPARVSRPANAPRPAAPPPQGQSSTESNDNNSGNSNGGNNGGGRHSRHGR
ncbi:MAG: DUF3300 domain-containing protein [Nibricoccus sp.]